MSKKDHLERIQEMHFLESSLWGAITFTRIFHPEINVNDIIDQFLAYLKLDSDKYSPYCLRTMYYRTVSKVRVMNNIDIATPHFPSESKEMVKELEVLMYDTKELLDAALYNYELTDALKKKIENGQWK